LYGVSLPQGFDIIKCGFLYCSDISIVVLLYSVFGFREGVLVYLAKVVVIVNIPPPTSAKNFFSTLGHTGYYSRFIRRYATITAPLENLLKKSEVFQWMPECDKVFDIRKENLSTTLFMIFPNWENEFHVHVDASGISLGSILAQPGDGSMDHPIYLARRKLLQVEHNYTTTER
jgi:hypothetical protein